MGTHFHRSKPKSGNKGERLGICGEEKQKKGIKTRRMISPTSIT
jgi:hypothetical protein